MDYTGLFRDRIYSGLDRIASANQMSTGLTTRIYDDALVERFTASLGQIYYFDRARTGEETLSTDKIKTPVASFGRGILIGKLPIIGVFVSACSMTPV